MSKSKQQSTWRKTALLVAAAAAAVAACGGGETLNAQPVLGAPTGPLALIVDGSGAFTLPAGNATEYQKHLSIATANAGKGSFADPGAPRSAAYYDPAVLRYQWCHGAENVGVPAELNDRAQVPPTQIFDNIWAFGLRNVLQYGFRTDNNRVFVMDTLNNTAEAQTITEPGITAMGFSASQLVSAFPTHGHGDHLGGAGYLQQTYGIPIYLGSADAASATTPATGRLTFTATLLDSTNLQPQEIDFGGVRATMLSTPGHTPGTFSGIMPAKLGGTEYKLAFWGGTAFSNTVAGSRNYLDGAERIYRLAQARKVDGTFHTHAFVDGSLQKLDALKANPGLKNTANPFLIGNALALRSLATLRECSAAKAAQVDATAKIAAWHVTAIEASSSSKASSTLRLTATVRTPYGVLQNGVVKFTVAPKGESCTAATDAKGQASCVLPTDSPATVTAEFVEGTLADGSLQLGSSTTITLK